MGHTAVGISSPTTGVPAEVATSAASDTGQAAVLVRIPGGVTVSSTAAPTAALNGGKNVAVTGTAVQLPSGACSGAVITANSTNAASIFVGISSVTKDYGTTTSGAELQPGQSVGVAIDNLNRLYVNGTSGDGVNWLAS